MPFLRPEPRARRRGPRPAARGRAALVALAVALGGPLGAARAQYPPITSRDYAIDLHRGPVLGPTRMIGMGGTAVALADGSAGLLANPAAVAMRPASARSRWDWDGHLDFSWPGFGGDFDNNGHPQASSGLRSAFWYSLGLLVLYERWGFGLAREAVSFDVRPPPSGAQDVTSLQVAAGLVRLAVGRSFLDEALVAGLSVRSGLFEARAADDRILFDVTGQALEAGLIVAPRDRSTRLGARLGLPVRSVVQAGGGCDPLNCSGYVLPERALVPAELALGIAHRIAPRPWNRAPAERFADEVAWTFALDLVVTGGVDRGAGLEKFTERQLQPSGRGTTLSVRAGAEWEALPGRLRLRGGTYVEPARFEGARARVHVTTGLEWRLFAFTLWGAERRLSLSLTGDRARDYGNGGLSLGLWN